MEAIKSACHRVSEVVQAEFTRLGQTLYVGPRLNLIIVRAEKHRIRQTHQARLWRRVYTGWLGLDIKCDTEG